MQGLEEELDSARVERDQLGEELAKLVPEHKALATEAQSLSDMLHQARLDLDQAKREKAMVEEQLQDKSIEALEAVQLVPGLSQGLSDLKHEAQELGKQAAMVPTLTEDVLQMQRNLEGANQESRLLHERLNAQLHQAEDDARVIAELEAKNKELAETIGVRTQQGNHAQQEVAELKVALEMPCAQCAESSELIPELMTALQHLRDELADKTEEYNSLMTFHTTHMEKHAQTHHEKHSNLLTKERHDAMMSKYHKKKTHDQVHEPLHAQHRQKHKHLDEKKASLIADYTRKNDDRAQKHLHVQHLERHNDLDEKKASLIAKHANKNNDRAQKHLHSQHLDKQKDLNEKKALLIDDHNNKNDDRKARYEMVMLEREQTMDKLMKDHMTGMLKEQEALIDKHDSMTEQHIQMNVKAPLLPFDTFILLLITVHHPCAQVMQEHDQLTKQHMDQNVVVMQAS